MLTTKLCFPSAMMKDQRNISQANFGYSSDEKIIDLVRLSQESQIDALTATMNKPTIYSLDPEMESLFRCAPRISVAAY